MTLAEIQAEAKSLITYDNVPGALEFAEKLEKSLVDNNIREANPTAYRELSKVIFQLYVTAIPNLQDELLFNIISFNLIEALSPIWPSERDLASRIESKYSIYPIELIKEMMRKDLLPLVEKNSQQIGNVPLRLSQDNPEAKPIIANWIEYYNRSIGINTINPFERSKFISSNPVVQTLTSIEKEALRKVIAFYDYLKNDETILYSETYDNSSNNPATSPNPTTTSATMPPKSVVSTNASHLQQSVNNIIASSTPNNSNTSSTATNASVNSIPNKDINFISSSTQFSPTPIPARSPIPPRTSAPIILTAKPVPIPKNVVNLKRPE